MPWIITKGSISVTMKESLPLGHPFPWSPPHSGTFTFTEFPCIEMACVSTLGLYTPLAFNWNFTSCVFISCLHFSFDGQFPPPMIHGAERPRAITGRQGGTKQHTLPSVCECIDRYKVTRHWETLQDAMCLVIKTRTKWFMYCRASGLASNSQLPAHTDWNPNCFASV